MADNREVLLFSKHHQDGMLESMHQLRLQGHLCDVTVQVDYQGALEEFEVHQVVLAASCGYFRDILLVKDSPSKLFISNMHSSDFSTVLTFAYTGKAGVIKEKISEIQQAAILLDCKELVDACSKAMDGESPFEWVNKTKSPLDTADDVVGLKKSSKARTKKPPKQVMRKRKLNPISSEKDEGNPKQAKVDDATHGEKEAPPEEAIGGRRLSSRLAGRKVFTGIMRKHMRRTKEPSKASDKTADSQEGREKTHGEAGAELESEAGKAEEGEDVSLESALESDDGEVEEEVPVDDRKDPLYLTLEEERECVEQSKRASRRSAAQFTCEKCQRTFHYERSYLKHISTYHGVTTDITYRCETCQQTFANRGNLKIHEKHVHNDERMYSCEVCTKTFKRKKDVLRHQRQVHEGGGPRHICPECGKALSSKTALLLHERTHSGAKPFDCTDCGAKFSQSSALKMHRRIHTGEKPFACDVCDARFTQKHMLAYHKRSHTGEKPFMCEACGKSFASKEYLRHHSNIHTGSRPYKCKQCGRGFAQRNSLHQHMKIHTGERPYCCKDCDKQFTQLNALQRHQRIHTGEKPYMCGLCNRTFTDKSTVRRHTLTHDTDAPWKNYLVVLKGNVEGKKPKASPKAKAEKAAAGEKSSQAGGESNPEAGAVVTEPITLAGDWAGAGTIALVSHTTLGGFTLIQAEVPAGSQIQNPIIATDSTGTSIISLDGTAISVPFSIPMSLAAHSIPVSSPSPVTVSEAELTSVSETATISTSSVLETVVSQTILAPLSMEEEPVPEAAMLDPDIHTVVVGEGVGSGLSPKLDGVGEQTLTALADEEPSIAEVTCTGETEVSTEGAV